MAKQSNAELPKSIATFVGEAKRAMHPKVRDDFADILAVRDAAWQAEDDARQIDKAAPAPIKKAFARKYHFLITLLGEAAEDKWYTTVEECVAFAESRDPDFDPAKVFKRLEKIREMLSAFHADFPVGDIEVCADFLSKITQKELIDARNEKLGVVPQAKVVRTRAGNVTVSPTVVENNSAAPEQDASEDVAEGASDILEDVLREFSAAA
jgi:hypothetical protein